MQGTTSRVEILEVIAKVIFAEHAINLLSSLDLVVVVVQTRMKASAIHSGWERFEVFTLMLQRMFRKVSFSFNGGA